MITMTKPIDSSRKSDRKLKTEEGNPTFRSQRNLSKDHDRCSDSDPDTIKPDNGKSEIGKS